MVPVSTTAVQSPPVAVVMPRILPSDDDARFGRYFSSRQISSDVFGTCVGACVYLGLLPSLAALRRPDLCAAAVACSALCLWPLLLSRRAKGAYVRHRDALLAVHFLFHYAVGSQMARFVRLHRRVPHSAPPAFLAGFVLSSTVLWQMIDALLYRMRIRNFLLFKPIILLVSLPLERQLCQQTCDAMPGEAPYFGMAADGLRLLLSAFQPMPHPLAVNGAPDGAATSCFKVQAFLLVMLSWVLPAFMLHSLEKQALRKFRQQSAAGGALGEEDAATAAAGPLFQQAAVAAAAAVPAVVPEAQLKPAPAVAAAAAAAGRSWQEEQSLFEQHQEDWSLFEQQELEEEQQQQQELEQQQQQQEEEGEESSGSLGLYSCGRWALPLLLVGLSWHIVDTLVAW